LCGKLIFGWSIKYLDIQYKRPSTLPAISQTMSLVYKVTMVKRILATEYHHRFLCNRCTEITDLGDITL
ncbi:MAG: hypothetical protein KBD41_17510, partial [Saprospiraceae bacterium]|nr:hypothetical protein [Saprospiraceae bacterium]